MNYFDGASNVQKAGRVLEINYPKVTSLKGSEHVTSLVFGDIKQLAPVNYIISIYRSLYRYFSRHHVPHAMMLEESKIHNNGRAIGLIRATDVRMGGHIICLTRLLRLKPVFDSLIVSRHFLDIKENIRVKTCVIKWLKDETLWKNIFVLVRSCFPLLKLLRLCDKREPAMDRLMYYVRQTDAALEKSIGALDTIQDDHVTHNRNMKSDITHYFDKEGSSDEESNVDELATLKDVGGNATDSSISSNDTTDGLAGKPLFVYYMFIFLLLYLTLFFIRKRLEFRHGNQFIVEKT